MIRTYDLALVWTMTNRAWIDRCFHSFTAMAPLWRRENGREADRLFQFVHAHTAADPLLRRLPSGVEIRVGALDRNDLVVTVSNVRRNLHEMLCAYEVANRIGASHAPYVATGMMGSQCRAAFLVQRRAHLTSSHVEPFRENDIVAPELGHLRATQKQQYEQRGYVTAGENVLFLEEGSDDVFPVDGRHFARDPLPGPRAATPSTTPPRRRTARIPPTPLISQLLEARPAWLTPELAASATQLRMFVNLMQDRGSAATKVHLGDPTRPATGCVTLPIYVPLTDDADGELAARLQWVTRFAETAEVRLRRRCGTCRRGAVVTPTCRSVRSIARTRTVLPVARASAAAPGTDVDVRPARTWSCGRCPSARFEEETLFVCPACRALVSPLDALNGCPACGHTPG